MLYFVELVVVAIVDETYKALLAYEKLLDLYSRMTEDQISSPDIWTDDFLHGIYLNASLAYKSVGNLDSAVHYATKYLQAKHGADNPRGTYECSSGLRGVMLSLSRLLICSKFQIKFWFILIYCFFKVNIRLLCLRNI